MILPSLAAEIARKYPNQISITSASDETGKFAGYAHRQDEEGSLLLSTDFAFQTAKEAEDFVNNYLQEIIASYVFGV